MRAATWMLFDVSFRARGFSASACDLRSCPVCCQPWPAQEAGRGAGLLSMRQSQGVHYAAAWLAAASEGQPDRQQPKAVASVLAAGTPTPWCVGSASRAHERRPLGVVLSGKSVLYESEE